MSGTFWLLIVGGVWLVVLGTLGICASAVKDIDRTQSEVLTSARRTRLIASHRAPRPRVGGWTRASG